MYSIRKWLYKPKKEDTSVLAQFFYADEELNLVATELDSFDGRKDPERCTALVNQLRQCQDKVLNICSRIMDEVIPNQRANRDFRVKFPDDILQENLAGQLWFGAECLAAGSCILNREEESFSIRPLAKNLTKTLDGLRSLMREQCLRNPNCYSDKIREALCAFDHLFAEFELRYVSAMVPVKTMKEYDMQQDLIVLFSETLQRALRLGLVQQESVDDYDPALMFTIPRLAIVCGLLIYPNGPLNLEKDATDISEMFRPFLNLLKRIRELLWTLSQSELLALEKTLCSVEDSVMVCEVEENHPDLYPSPMDDYFQKVYQNYPVYRQFISNMVSSASLRPPSPSMDEEVPDSIVDVPHPLMQTTSGEFSDGQLNDAVTNFEHDDLSVLQCSCEGLLCVCNASEKNGYRTMRDAVNEDLPPQMLCTKCKSVMHIERSAEESSSSPVRKFSPAHGPTPAKRSRSIPLSRRILKNLSPSHNSQGTTSTNNSPSNWDANSYYSTDTSSYNSDCQDDEEIALHLQAREFDSRQSIREKFKDSSGLIHRLFVCISGVADHLQTSDASDLRNILKCVFEMNCSQPAETPITPSTCSSFSDIAEERVSIESAEEASERDEVHTTSEEAPAWIPDILAPDCMMCKTPFTIVRRRHHCRNCGKVFCGRCSSNFVPLPRYGLTKPVRVCSNCFVYQVTPLVIATHSN